MKTLGKLPGGRGELRLVITDSGLGGLSICAELEKGLRGEASKRPIRLIYINAWPDPNAGYNDLPDPASRARVLDRALAGMMKFKPSLILIACNTLSVLYGLTEFSRAPSVPVLGIIEAGVDLFYEALSVDPQGHLVLFGTRTTVESGEHLRRLARRGIAAGRMSAAACHGLAGAIDNNPDGPSVPGLVEECVRRAVSGLPGEGRLYAGLCCTHYAYVRDLFRASLEPLTGNRVEILDPNERLVKILTSGLGEAEPVGSRGDMTVEVVSKVELGEGKRKAVARRLEPVSPLTARALVGYVLKPDLF